MTRTAYLDLVGGVAGDMFLCALLDAAESAGCVEAVLADLRALPVDAAGIRTASVLRHGIRALALVGAPPAVHGPTRSLAELLAIVAACPLPPRAALRAARVFTRLAEAEARVHGRAVSDVRLEEAGSDDAVIDVVGVCLALEALGIERVECSPVPLGGRIHAEPQPHDTEPHAGHHVHLGSWPAPATAELLRGLPVTGPPPFGEATTPTGAALVTTLAERFGPAPSMTLDSIGYGAGARDPADTANVVRVLVGETPPTESPAAGTPTEPVRERLVVIEANLDDLSPQHAADAADALRAAGSLDAWIVPALMKKGRPGFILSALVVPDRADAVRRAFFLHTPTLGVRETLVERTAIARRVDTVAVRGMPVRVKVGLFEGAEITATPEHDDAVAAARVAGLSALQVSDEARATWRSTHSTDRPAQTEETP
jgi:pyridinium-3,5-bisthiocarboxylic acid mononucleotide nickel chelatase